MPFPPGKDRVYVAGEIEHDTTLADRRNARAVSIRK